MSLDGFLVHEIPQRHEGRVAEWFKAAVLKTASRKGRGFESYPFRQENQKTGVRRQKSGVLPLRAR